MKKTFGCRLKYSTSASMLSRVFMRKNRLSWAALDLAGEVVRHGKTHRNQDELLEQELSDIERLLFA
jgi:hypothetical protein